MVKNRISAYRFLSFRMGDVGPKELYLSGGFPVLWISCIAGWWDRCLRLAGVLICIWAPVFPPVVYIDRRSLLSFRNVVS